MARTKRSYNPEKKAAVMAALLAGQGVTEIAESYNIPAPTIRRWRTEITAEQRAALAAKKADLGELISGYLAAILTALTAQAGVAADPAWIRQQPADELAVFHGVLADKGFRIIAALEQRTTGPETS